MNDSKSAAQVAYETLIEKLQSVPEADAATFAPPWYEVPEPIREAIGTAVGVALADLTRVSAELRGDDSECEFAELAYRAYIKTTGGLNYEGKPCPKWTDLPERIQAAWGAATLATRTEHDSRLDVELHWLEGNALELAQLVAGLDALQERGTHRQDVLVPLRARLRAALTSSLDEDELETDDAATEPASAEALPPQTTADLSVETGAPAAPVAVYSRTTGTYVHPDSPAAKRESELPTPSAAPSGPSFHGLEPLVPGSTMLVADGVHRDAKPFDVEPKAAQLEVLGEARATDTQAATTEAAADGVVFRAEGIDHEAVDQPKPPEPKPPEVPTPSVTSAHVPGAPAAEPTEPASADAPAVGVIPAGKVQTSAEAARTQTPHRRR